jgi:hypothetical protein
MPKAAIEFLHQAASSPSWLKPTVSPLVKVFMFAQNLKEAEIAVDDMMVKKLFGTAAG